MSSSVEPAVVPRVLETFPSEMRFTRASPQHELSVVYVKQAPSTPGTMNMTTRFVKFDVRTTSPRLFTIKGGRRRAIQVNDAATVLIRAKVADGALTTQQREALRADPDTVVRGRFLVSFEYITEEQYAEASRGWRSLVRGEGTQGSGGASASPSMGWKGRNFDMLVSGSVVVPWEVDLRHNAPLYLAPAATSSAASSAVAKLESSVSSTEGRLLGSSSGGRGVLSEHLQEEVNVVRAQLAEVEEASLRLIDERRQLLAMKRAQAEARAKKAQTLREVVWRAVDSVAWVEVAAVGLMLCSTALLALNI